MFSIVYVDFVNHVCDISSIYYNCTLYNDRYSLFVPTSYILNLNVTKNCIDHNIIFKDLKIIKYNVIKPSKNVRCCLK